jgi:hypothetical protein
LLREVRESDWAAWSIPYPGRLFDYEPERVPTAFESLVSADGDEERRRAYNRMLDAVGHNHSGTPYAAMVPATRLLARLIPLLDKSAPVALEALVDCVRWSQGEPPFVGPDGRTHEPGPETLRNALALRALIEEWSRDDDPRRCGPARDLLKLADDAGV